VKYGQLLAYLFLNIMYAGKVKSQNKTIKYKTMRTATGKPQDEKGSYFD